MKEQTQTVEPMVGKIYSAILAANREIEAIAKNRRNTQQNFRFRGIDDCYNSLHGVLTAAGVFTVPQVIGLTRETRTTAAGGILYVTVLEMRYRFLADDGSFVDAVVVGEAMDSADKATNKAMSAAHKYALLQVFTVPTEDIEDGDRDTTNPTETVAGITDDQAKTIEKLIADNAATKPQAEWYAKYGKTCTTLQADDLIAKLSARAAKKAKS
jgi:hypothetical protein